MNLKASLSKILSNKWVLIIVSLFAFLNVVGYIIVGNFNSLAYFIVFALFIRYFSKNMILILGIPLLLANLLSLKGYHIEGLENQSDNDKTDEDKKKEEQNKTIKKINQQDAKTKQGLPITPLDHTANTDNTSDSNVEHDESFEVGRGKKKSYDIDYAATVEDAYDELNKILGSDGIKRLTSDTQKLMKQQMQLAESMKTMEPMIKSMEPMMEQAQKMLTNMSDGKEGIGSIMQLAKKFTGKSGADK